MGWLPDYPSHRDYTMNQDEVSSRHKQFGQKDSIKAMIRKIGVENPSKLTMPKKIDLRKWCSPIENQGNLGSCTANAGVGLVEYFEKRAFGKHIDASRLFLYKATRNLLNWTGDTGAFLRSTMEALVLFGVPPENYCPYEIENFENEPSAFCYAFAQNYQAISYYRLDPSGTTKSDLLNQIKAHLTAGLPSMFGFTVYQSIDQAGGTGDIPYPTLQEKEEGGHAVVAVGFDDDKKIQNGNSGAKATKGAFLIRNSWGQEWGDRGYGWLPYDYVLSGLAEDWWTLLKCEWVNTNQFKA